MRGSGVGGSVPSNYRPNKYLSLLVWLLPNSPFKHWALRKLGNRIGNRVHVGTNLVLSCGPFFLEDDVIIRTGNVFRNLAGAKLERAARIGAWNQITAAPGYQQFSDRVGTLIMAEMSLITYRHYLDCSGQVVIGRNSAIGGVKSIVQSHEFDMRTALTTVGRVTIGENTMCTTGVLLLKGANVPDRSILAAGSVMPKAKEGEEMPTGLYAGIPARHLRELSGFAWWHRTDLTVPITDFDDHMFTPLEVGIPS